jgi:uncharacterized protein (TIGR02452 family)
MINERLVIWKHVKELCESYLPKVAPVKYTVTNIDTSNVNNKPFIEIEKNDTLDFVIENDLDNPLVLIFADNINPGGSIESGNGMQEESLFRRTYLAAHLKKHLYPIKHNEAIYCKDVTVFRMSESKNNKNIPLRYYSFIACPCASQPEYPLTQETVNVISDKIRLIIETGIANGHNNFVFGAWGCGVFGCRPNDIAVIFKRIISGYQINAYFPILGNNNVYQFKKSMGL